MAQELRLDIVDAPLLKVPFESLKRAAKERKSLVDEAGEALSALSTSGSKEEQLQQLDQLVSRLQGLKRKLADVSQQEAGDALRCKARLEHLGQLGCPNKGSVVVWNKQRLDRLLVDHMLRSGNHNSAGSLADETGSEPLSDMHIFRQAQRVIDSLRQHDCSAALAWCADNRVRLKKVKSSLEFKLRLQEFLELVAQDQRLAAVQYARAHLAPWASQHMPELQRVLASLAFGAGSKVSAYKELFSEGRWAALLEHFLRELYRLHALLPESALTVHLQAGLIALKNPPSTSSSSREDPLQHPDFKALAADLPCAKHVHSKLICAVTREIMNDANPPMVLPNGYVYSNKAIDQIAAKNNGRIVCPHTGAEFGYDEARRAFIV